MVSNAAFEQAVLDALASIKTDVASLKTDVASLKTDVASLKTDVASLKTTVAQLDVRVSNLEKQAFTHYTSTTRELRDFRAEVGHRFLHLEERVSGVELVMTDLVHAVTGHDRRITALENSR